MTSQEQFSEPISKYVQKNTLPMNNTQGIPPNFPQQQLQQQQMQQMQQQQQMQQMQQQQLQQQMQSQSPGPLTAEELAKYKAKKLQELQQVDKDKTESNSDDIMSKLKKLLDSECIKNIFIIAILFLVFTSQFYKDNITKYLTFITIDNGNLNTIGLLLTSIIVGLLYVIIKLFC
jgi:Fe2+ transport system protein B